MYSMFKNKMLHDQRQCTIPVCSCLIAMLCLKSIRHDFFGLKARLCLTFFYKNESFPLETVEREFQRLLLLILLKTLLSGPSKFCCTCKFSKFNCKFLSPPSATINIAEAVVHKCFFKIGVRKTFAIFTGKDLCYSLFLIKLHSNTGVLL